MLYLAHVAAGGGTPIGGYVSLQDNDANGAPATSFTVLFFTPDPEPRIAYRVQVPFTANARVTVEDEIPLVLPAREVAELIRARRTASLALPPTTSQLINTVVLRARPFFDEDGILVYLLAGTKRPGIAVLGLHHRVLVSADGQRVVRFEPMSKGPLEQPLAPPGLPTGAKAAGLVTSHSVTAYPLETHVFESLLYRLPISLVTPHGGWQVDGEHIEFTGPIGTGAAQAGKAAPVSPSNPVSPPDCSAVCADVVGRCPRGPRDMRECVSVCSRIRDGACAKRYQELFTCAGAAPEYACDGRGAPTVRRCEQEYETMLRCFAGP